MTPLRRLPASASRASSSARADGRACGPSIRTLAVQRPAAVDAGDRQQRSEVERLDDAVEVVRAACCRHAARAPSKRARPPPDERTTSGAIVEPAPRVAGAGLERGGRVRCRRLGRDPIATQPQQSRPGPSPCHRSRPRRAACRRAARLAATSPGRRRAPAATAEATGRGTGPARRAPARRQRRRPAGRRAPRCAGPKAARAGPRPPGSPVPQPARRVRRARAAAAPAPARASASPRARRWFTSQPRCV